MLCPPRARGEALSMGCAPPASVCMGGGCISAARVAGEGFARTVAAAGDMCPLWAATGLCTVRPASDGATRPVPLSSQPGHC